MGDARRRGRGRVRAGTVGSPIRWQLRTELYTVRHRLRGSNGPGGRTRAESGRRRRTAAVVRFLGRVVIERDADDGGRLVRVPLTTGGVSVRQMPTDDDDDDERLDPGRKGRRLQNYLQFIHV